MIKLQRSEIIPLALLGLALVIGVWHGYPFPNVVGDEMYFVGGPLRALAHHTLVPLFLDVPYGTITYLLNYLVWIPVLAFLLVLKGFHLSGVQSLLLQEPFAGYILTRLLSASVMMSLFLILLTHFKKWNKLTVTEALPLLVITFFNILVLVLSHTGKVWVVSVFLYATSLVAAERLMRSNEHKLVQRYAALSIISAWAAFANFPIMGIALLTLPWLLALTYKKKISWSVFVGANGIGLGVLLFVYLLNGSSVLTQISGIFTDYSILTSTHKYGLSFLPSLRLNIMKVSLLFPSQIILLLAWARRGRREDTTQSLLCAHLGMYILLISLIVSWSVSLDSFLRYLMPLPFLIVLLLATYKQGHRALPYTLTGITFIFAVRALFLISVPTTYTYALEWTKANLGGEEAVLVNNVHYDFDLTRNATSSRMLKDGQCGTVCQSDLQTGRNNSFMPVVVDEHSEPNKVALMNLPETTYTYTTNRVLGQGDLVAEFQSGAPDGSFYSLNSLGSYFDPLFWHLKRLGRNVYIYKSSAR